MKYVSDRKYTLLLNVLLFVVWPLIAYIILVVIFNQIPMTVVCAALWALVLKGRLSDALVKSKSKFSTKLKGYRIVAGYLEEQAKINTTRGHNEMDI